MSVVTRTLVVLLVLAMPQVSWASLATSQTEVTYDLGKADFKAKLRGVTSVTFCLYEQNTGGTPVFCDTKVPTQYVIERVKADKEGAARTLFGSTSFYRVVATVGSDSNPVDVGSGGELWLEVSTAHGALPRREFGSALFSVAGAPGGGGVTQVNTGAGLQGGPITSTGTVALDAPTCSGTDKLTWNGTALVCAADDTGGASQLSILQAVYPVGSIYINAAASTNPAALLGFGTWTEFGAGRVLVGLNGGDVDFDSAEETGGSKTHTLTEAELPPHTHTVGISGVGTPAAYGGDNGIMGSNGAVAGQRSYASTAGGGAPHNNVQPYVVVYMWKRAS